MSKVLIFSDIHIHPHKRSTERLQDCLDTLDWVFKTAVDEGINSVLFLGDLFHERQKIDVLTYLRTVEIFEKYLVEKSSFDVYLLLGNHDLWFNQKWDVSAVKPLRNLPRVTIIDHPTTLNIEGTEISFLPYTHNPIEDLKKIKNDSQYKILCGHLAVDGAVWNKMAGTTAEVSVEHDGDMKVIDTSVFSDWNKVFLGHYHAEQRMNDIVEYVGSPLQLSFGEAFQHKHVILYDLKTKKQEYVRNKFSPQHFIIPEADIEKYEIEGNFLKIIVDDISASEVVELRKDLLDNQKAGSLEIKPAEKSLSDQKHEIEDAKSILDHKGEMIEKYVDEVNPADLERDKLLEIGRTICNQD